MRFSGVVAAYPALTSNEAGGIPMFFDNLSGFGATNTNDFDIP